MSLEIRQRFVLDIVLNNMYTRQFGIEQRLFIEKQVGESIEHVAMKLLTYLITYTPGLEIEVSIGDHYKPDVVRVSPAGEVVLWGDCGQTRLTKLATVSNRHRHATFVITKKTQSELRHYYRRAVARFEHLAGVNYLAFAPPGLAPICAALHKRHRITATVDEGPDMVYLSLDESDWALPLIRLGAWRSNAG